LLLSYFVQSCIEKITKRKGRNKKKKEKKSLKGVEPLVSFLLLAKNKKKEK